MKSAIISVIAGLLLNGGGITPVDGKIKLLPPPDNKIYFSAYPAFQESWEADFDTVENSRIAAFELLAQKQLSWITFSQYWADGIRYPQQQVHIIHDQGSIPLIRMQAQSRVDGHIVENVGESLFSLQNIINGDFDDDLRQWARAAKQDNIPLLIDFGVEVNGRWFPWNGSWNGGGETSAYGAPDYPDGPERFRDAYRHIIKLFRSEQVKHVTWFFHVTMHTTEPPNAWNEPKWYYPGDDYIDWIGVSIYGELYPALNYWDSFDDVMENNDAYLKVLEISSKKPYAILEMGVTDHSVDGSKQAWLNGAFQSILSQKYIPFKALNYWHEDWDNNGSMTTLKINSSAGVLNTFQTNIANPVFISNGYFSLAP